MSKKMMKRSLALGALMAFVITGSAMAAGLYVDNQTYTEPAACIYSVDGENDADGVLARFATVTLNNGANISASISKIVTHDEVMNNGYGVCGVRALSDTDKTPTVITFAGDTTTISAKGNWAWGVMVSGGAESKVALDSKNTKIDVTYDDNASQGQLTGIQAQYGSDAVSSSADSNVVVNVTAGKDVGSNLHAMGIVAMPYLDGAGEIDLQGSLNATVVNNGAGEANGINAYNGGKVNLADATITAQANKNASYGAYVYGKSELNATGGMTINASSNGGTAYGIYGENDTKVDLAETTITATSKTGSAYGVYAFGEHNNFNIGDKGKDVNINVDASGYAVGVEVIPDSKKNGRSEVAISGNVVDITATSKNNYAVGVEVVSYTNNSTDKVNTLIIDANDTYITATSGYNQQESGEWSTYGIVNYSDGIVKINDGNLTVNAGTVLSTRGNATTEINIENNPEYVVKLTGDISYSASKKDNQTDDIAMKTNTTINLTNSESFLLGNIVQTGDEAVSPKGMTLGLSNGATWTTVANETNGEKNFVNTLNMNGGILNVAEGTKVQIGIGENDTGWSGNGSVVVNSLDEAQVTINNKVEGSTVTVQGSEKITDAVAVSANQATEMQKLADTVQDGKKVSAADTVTTTESEIAGAITAQVDENGKVIASTIKEATNTTNQAIGEAAVALKAHWRAHMNDMNKRMGELRNANGEAGVWARMVRGEAEYESAKAQYNQYQLGYDEKLSVDKRWTVGAAVTFAEGDSSFGKGTTEDDSTAFAIYGSKLNDDGTFIDLIARYARVESDVTSYTGNTGDYSTNGYSVSAEFGKRIQQGNGLWIEPQVELTYGTIDSADYKLDGKDIHVGDMDSIIGRVGFSIGKDVKQGNVYARASYLYDFDGETETTFTANGITRPIEEDLGGGWWEVGVGANINLSKATYIYADVEKTFGGEVDTNWQWNLGVRYSF